MKSFRVELTGREMHGIIGCASSVRLCRLVFLVVSALRGKGRYICHFLLCFDGQCNGNNDLGSGKKEEMLSTQFVLSYQTTNIYSFQRQKKRFAYLEWAGFTITPWSDSLQMNGSEKRGRIEGDL